MYQLINVTGVDADSFLQGQLTQDVARLKKGSALRSAWCNPKGRVVATMTILRSDDGVDLLLPEDIAESFLQRLSIYKMRADVRLTLATDWNTVAVQSESGLQQLQQTGLLPTTVGACSHAVQLTAVCVATDPLLVEVFGGEAAMQKLQEILDDGRWRTALIRCGNVQIGAQNSEKYTPHMLSLDLANAVSFDKGCYTGQEVVARTEHRGRSRRRLAGYECDASGHAAGDELLDDDSVVGTVVNASGNAVLAVTTVDSQGKTLLLDGKEAQPVRLPWQS